LKKSRDWALQVPGHPSIIRHLTRKQCGRRSNQCCRGFEPHQSPHRIRSKIKRLHASACNRFFFSDRPSRPCNRCVTRFPKFSYEGEVTDQNFESWTDQSQSAPLADCEKLHRNAASTRKLPAPNSGSADQEFWTLPATNSAKTKKSCEAYGKHTQREMSCSESSCQHVLKPFATSAIPPSPPACRLSC
jgi:hypothetical protein